MDVYIYGSSVSREAFDLADAPSMVGYSARSTLGSAFSGPVDLSLIPDFDLRKNKSPFQQRLVVSDIQKTLGRDLASYTYDWLLLDFIDERFSVLPVGDGLVTQSAEAIACGVPGRSPEQFLFGSAEHLAAFAAGWNKLLEIVSAKKIVINRVYWAEFDSEGRRVEDALVVARSNKVLDQLYDLVAQSPEVRFIEYPLGAFVASSSHKWGRSPFHYIEDVYKATVEALSRLEQGTGNQEKLGQELMGDPRDEERLRYALAGRAINDRCLVTFGSNDIIFQGAHFAPEVHVRSAGLPEVDRGVWRCLFEPGLADYVTSIRFPTAFLANAAGMRVKLSGWESVKYVAVGNADSDGFRHIKVAHPIQEQWYDIAFSYDDLLYGIQNGHSISTDPVAVTDLRIFIKGVPGSAGASLLIRWAAAWLESARTCAAGGAYGRDVKDGAAVVSLLRNHLWETNTQTVQDIPAFLSGGGFPVSGHRLLEWRPEEQLPRGLKAVGTYRYLWHSLSFAAMLTIYADKFGDHRAFFAGKDMVTAWLEGNLYVEPSDAHYAWYDHAVAERLIAMIIVREAGYAGNYDERFMGRISVAIEYHAVLLESDAFYAANQITRFHNHAWFQDLALIAAGMVSGSDLEGARWVRNGLQRMQGQVDELVIEDEGFAVFAENSSGYHDAAAALLRQIGKMATMAGQCDALGRVGNALDAWSRYFLYPDGRRPANGDTFRLGNGDAPRSTTVDGFAPSFKVLENAGYALVKGDSGSIPFMVCVLATSLTPTHKHADDLSFTLFFDGVEWLIDPSYFSHEYDAPIPSYLRGPWAHNTIVIAECPYNTSAGFARLSGQSQGETFSIQGLHSRYSGFIVRRTVEGNLNKLQLRFTDQLEGVGAGGLLGHEAYSVLHLGESVAVRREGNCAILYSDLSSREIVVDLGTRDYRIVAGIGDDQISTSVTGTDYGQINETISILIPHQRNVPRVWNMSERSGESRGLEGE